MTAKQAAQALGRLGGKVRAARLSSLERRQIAAQGGRARSLSFHAARRIRDNFSYLAVVDQLRRSTPTVERLRTFTGPLPNALTPDGDGKHERPSRHRR